MDVQEFNSLTHSGSTSIVGFNDGLVVTKISRAGPHGQDHLLTYLLIHLHRDHNILTDNSQSLYSMVVRASLSELSRPTPLAVSM